MATLAQRYSEASIHRQAEDGLKLIKQVSLPKNSKVLDLGCGTGYLSSVLAERVGAGGKVVGVDSDKERIRLARERYGGVGNLVFVEGSGEEFPEGPYDLVFSNHAFHWIKNKESVFRKVYGNLTVGGQLAFTAVENTETSGSTPFYISCEEYVDMAVKSGFVVDFKLAMARQYSFPNVDDFLEWVVVSTNSEFDRQTIESNSTSLETFKERYGHKELEFELPLVTFVLKVPWKQTSI